MVFGVLFVFLSKKKETWGFTYKLSAASLDDVVLLCQVRPRQAPASTQLYILRSFSITWNYIDASYDFTSLILLMLYW